MKKIKFLVLLVAVMLVMTSCYTSKVYHGEAKEKMPQVEVASKGNPIMLWGLLPLNGAQHQATDYVGEHASYTTKTTTTFLDGFLGFITLGIYCPTTTKFYVPLDSENNH